MRVILKEKSFAFAIRIVKLYKFLSDSKKEYVIARQVLRSGTAPGALIREAQNAESTNDFIHKLSIAQKECDETIYWLEILRTSEIIPYVAFESIYCDATELLKMIKSAILTSKEKIKKRQ